MRRAERDGKGPDLVRGVAVARDAIGAHDDEVHLFAGKHRGRRAVHEHLDLDPRAREFPRGEPRALQERARLVRVDQ